MPVPAPRPVSVVAVLLVLVTGAVALVVAESVPGAVVAELVVAVLAAPVTTLCLAAARAGSRRWALSWRLLAAGTVLWAVGNVVTVVSVWLPGRGINSGIYPLQGAAMALLLAALVLLPRPGWGPGQAPRAWLDVAVLVLSVALLGGSTVVGDAVAGAEGLDLAFALAYPSVALLVLGLAYELGRRHVYPPRPEVALLAAATGCWLVGAVTYALTPAALVAPARVSWAVGLGFVLLALAARRVVRRRPGDDEVGSLVTRAVMVMPEVAVGAATLAVILAGLGHWSLRLLAVLVGAGVVLRHAVTTADARRFSWRLEREVAERTAELRRWTAQYADILDTVGDGILSTDADGRVEFANASAAMLLATPPDALVGRDACAATCVHHGEPCPYDQALRGTRVEGVELELRRADGALVPVELHAAPRPGAGGAVVVVRDVSARLAVEQAKHQFVSSVSHELRTPLTSVRGVLEMIVDGDAGELSPLGHSLVANASRGVERLNRLVDDIIDVEKLASGEFRVQRTPTCLATVAHETVAALEPLASGAGVRLEVDAPPTLTVWGDRDRLEQALVNLVGNAVKFSPRGAAVRLEVGPGPGPGADPGAALVSVTDQGPGIPADQLEHVFERFHQVTVGEATDKGGTGLGLAITRSIVQQHGGRVWVDSVLGEGSTFRISLPTAAPAEVSLPDGRGVTA